MSIVRPSLSVFSVKIYLASKLDSFCSLTELVALVYLSGYPELVSLCPRSV
ncbi:hypothetical protein P692DRAFT_201798202, partial [Suillus brevipes Sb2]